MRVLLLLGMALWLAGCAEVMAPVMLAPAERAEAKQQARQAVERFVQVVDAVEPVAEAECRRQSPARNCDYLVAVDDRMRQPPNAFQFEGPSGRPVLVFTVSLIAEVGNADELALVMGHEAAHHILGHIERQQVDAVIGAELFTELATAAGASVPEIRQMQDVGAAVGARVYAKDYEIEADQLGARIARKAGFDPLRGVVYFTRMPDPGNQFLGTHPPNAQRVQAIRQAVGG